MSQDQYSAAELVAWLDAFEAIGQAISQLSDEGVFERLEVVEYEEMVDLAISALLDPSPDIDTTPAVQATLKDFQLNGWKR